eukprot:bmy_04907T0
MGKMRLQKIRTMAVEMRQVCQVDVPQKNGRKITTAPGNKIEKKKFLAPMFAEKLISPCRKGATGAKLPKDRRSAMLENHEKRHENPEEDEAKPPVSFKLFVGNLNFNKTVAELKTGLSEFFAKNDVAVVGVRVGLSRRFGYVNFKSADDQEKALELSETNVLGCEIKWKKPKRERKQRKVCKQDGNAKTLLIKNLPDRVTQHELIEVFEDTFQIRLVSKDGMSERIASVDFKSQADAERALEEKQGTEIGGLAVVLNLVGAKIQGQDERDRKKCNWRSKGVTAL